MNNLEELKITERQIEHISGLDVDKVFIGGIFGGTYRPSVLKKPKKFASLCLTELFVFVLTFIFSLPLGFLTIRNHNDAVNSLPVVFQFLQVTAGVTWLVFISWNIYMWFKIKHIETLAYLIDEIDKYNEIIQSVALLKKLEAVANQQVDLINRHEIIKALNVTKDTLICGLMTEKILRENRGVLARRYDLFVNLENNLVMLKALEVKNQANDYSQLLNNALQIGMSVHQEMQKLSHPS